jgi:K+-transporting ATPase A subunit
MKSNMGTADRVVRVLAAVVIAGLWYTGRISGTLAIVLLVIAGVFILTSFVGFCPAYLPFGLSTRGKSGSGTP